jgi:cytochrome c oxidase subunit 2
MFPQASTLAAGVDKAFFFILWISVALLVVITFLMVYFVVRYHRKRHKTPQDIEGNTILEIVWIVVPTILVLAMFYYGWVGFRAMRQVPANAMVVKVEARMWSWAFEYENGKRTDHLRVPLGRDIKLAMISRDMVHSLYIPAFRVKEDLVPRQETTMWFVSNRLGTYDIMCAEYCGMGHSRMMSKVIVMPEKDFQEWHNAPQGEAWVPMDGAVLVQKHGCLGCHSTDGSKLLGPTFKGLFGKERVVVTAGEERTVIADDVYIGRAIVAPEYDMVKGYQGIMPSMDEVLSEKEIEAIIAYLKELKS